MGNKIKPLSPPPFSIGDEESSTNDEQFSSIVEKVETKSKCDSTVSSIKQLLAMLQVILSKIENLITEIKSLKVTIENYIAVIKTLNGSVNKAVSGIDTAIDKAGKTSITVQLNPKHIQQLEAYKQEIVKQEKEARDDLFYKEREIMSEHYYALCNLLENKKGTWLSRSTFFVWMVATFILVGILLAILAFWIARKFN